MKKITILLLCLCAFHWAKADLGLPDIQAVCKVTLKDGTVVEGLVTIASGGYFYHYQSDGFCFVREDVGIVELRLFSLKFGVFQPDRHQAYRDGNAKLYFAQNQNFQNFPQTDYMINDSSSLVIRRTVDQDNFLMMDEMVMYHALPLSLYLNNNDLGEESEVRVNVADIQSVELVAKPSKKWLKVIEEARDRFRQ